MKSLSSRYQRRTESPEYVERPLSNLPKRTYKRLRGRDADLRALHKLLRITQTGAGTIVVVHGAPGVGKTSLALEAAWGYQEAYASLPRPKRFEAIIWASAQPLTVTADGLLPQAFLARTLDDIILVVAVTLREDEILRAVPDNQIPLVYRALSKQRVLLLFDNLETMQDERVLGFIRQAPPSTTVIVTSRIYLDLGLDFPVKPLERPHALALIQEVADLKGIRLSGDDQRKLLSLTGGVPLGIVLGIALVHHGNKPNVIFDDFRRVGGDFLSFCFDKHWEAIRGKPAEWLLESLTMFASSASSDALQYVVDLGVTPAALDEGLSLLERRLSLVDYVEGRWTALPLTKMYAAGRLGQDPEAERELRRRWAEYLYMYVRRSLQSPTWEEAFRSLDVERENISGLLAWAGGQKDGVTPDRASVTFHDVSYYLFSRGYWPTILSNVSWACRRLWEQGLVEEYLEVMTSWTARVHILQGNPAAIDGCFEEASTALQSQGEAHPLYHAIVSFNLASVLRREDRDVEALEALARAIQTFREFGRTEWLARALNRLGNTLAKLRRFEEAQAAYAEVVRIAATSGNAAWAREMVAYGMANSGVLANRRGDYNKAIGLLNESAPFITQLMDRAVHLMELAIALFHKRRFRESVELANQSSQLVSKLGLSGPVAESDPTWEVEVLPTLAARRFVPSLPSISNMKDFLRRLRKK